MSLTKAQAATSLSAKWEEGKYIVSNTVDQQAYLSFLSISLSKEKKVIL